MEAKTRELARQQLQQKKGDKCTLMGCSMATKDLGSGSRFVDFLATLRLPCSQLGSRMTKAKPLARCLWGMRQLGREFESKIAKVGCCCSHLASPSDPG